MLPKMIMSCIQNIQSLNNMDLNILGVDLWPVFRNTVMAMCTHSREGGGSAISRTYKLPSIRNFINLLTLKSVDTLILTDAKFSETVNGRKHYKEASIIAERVKKKNKTAALLLHNEPGNRDGYQNMYSMSVPAGVSYILAHLLSRFDRYSVLYRYVVRNTGVLCLKSEGFEELLKKRQILKNIYFVIIYSLLIKAILKRLTPSKCYVLCYYSCAGMAFCSACNQLNVKVADVQHGMSGKNMRAYGGWVRAKRNGYNTLPSRFLCWTHFDKEAIAEWAPCGVRAQVTGNLWRKYLFKNSLIQGALNEDGTLLEKIKSYDLVLLLTLQSDQVQGILKSLLSSFSSKNYFFLIRVHPNFRGVDLAEIEGKLLELNPKLLVVQPTIKPVHQVMKYVDIHITEWSASVYDAYFEGLMSIVVSPSGRDYFEVLAQYGVVEYLDNIEAISNRIEKQGKRYFVNCIEFYPDD